MNAPFFKIFVFDNLEEDAIPVEPDGYLGETEASCFYLDVEIPPGYEAIGFNVADDRSITKARDWREKPQDDEDPAMQTPEGTRIYRRNVPVVESDLRLCAKTTKYPQNNLRILQGLGDGYFQQWRVSIISQDGHFFLVTEKMYEPFRCYRSGTSVICPAHQEKWGAFVTFLNFALRGSAQEALPPIRELAEDEEKERPKAKLNGISQGQGRVVWYSRAEQMGMVMTKEGAARVHWTNIKPRSDSRLAHLNEGELVSYEELTRPHLTRARSTGFKLEAVGIKLIESD
jgi:hypothetical protein